MRYIYTKNPTYDIRKKNNYFYVWENNKCITGGIVDFASARQALWALMGKPDFYISEIDFEVKND